MSRRKHPIAEYLARVGLSQHKAAVEIGITQPYLNQIIHYRRRAGEATVRKLRAWSSGKLTADTLILENARVA